MSQDARHPYYRSYLLRVWERCDPAIEQRPVRCCSLEDPHTGARAGFATLAALLTFLAGDDGQSDGNDTEAEQGGSQ